MLYPRRDIALVNCEQITGIIFCGGRGRRLGGIEKPLIEVRKKALVEYVIERLRPQVERIILSIGADTNGYERFNCHLVTDATPDQGPLGGLVSALEAVDTDWIQTCPGDAPNTSVRLVQLLANDAKARGVAVAHDGKQRQNLTLLLHRDMAASLVRFFYAGGRAVHHWLDAEKIPASDLSRISVSFANINTPSELANFREMLGGGPT